MNLVRPTWMTNALFVSSTVPEADYATWTSDATFGLDAFCIKTPTHRVYQSLVAGNIGHDPETSPTQWLDFGPTNRWAMFDKNVGTSTSAVGPIVVVLKPGSIDSFAAIDTDAETVRVQMTDTSGVIYDVTKSTNLGGEAITSWYQWFFSPIGTRTILTFLDLPSSPNATLTVTFTAANPASPINIGTAIMGRSLDIGSTEAGPTSDIKDFSVKDTDDFGNVSIVERAFSKRMTARAMLLTDNVDATQREFAKVRATPCLWIAADHDSLIVFGFWSSFKFTFADENNSYCDLTIEGLT